MLKKIYHCNNDFIGLLNNDFGHIESNLGEICDSLLDFRSENYSRNFSNQFLPLIEECYKKLKFLPDIYIKVYK